MNAKVMIAIPNMGSLHTSLAELLIRWSVVPTPGVDQIAILAPQKLVPHDSARNWCVKKFLQESDCTHLFFIDSDVIPPKDALEKLIKHDMDIVCGAYPIKRGANDAKSETVYALFCKEGEGLLPIKAGYGLVQIDRAGTGCMLIKREVFDRIEMPAFRWEYNEEGLTERGEDIHFCIKAQAAGVPLMGDLDVICQHEKSILL